MEAADDFAARLDRLRRNVYPRSQGRPYTYEEVARAVTGSGVSVTPQYLQQLRTGRRTDPRQSCVAALAEFFGVPAEYFFSESVANEISRQTEELHVRIAEIHDGLWALGPWMPPGGLPVCPVEAATSIDRALISRARGDAASSEADTRADRSGTTRAEAAWLVQVARAHQRRHALGR